MTALKNILLFLFLSFSSVAFSQEICDNAIDDDGDGLIDLNDIAECACYGIGDITQANYYPLPNPSFEEMDYCPDFFSQVYCLTNWEQATSATSDYYNSCGLIAGALNDFGLVPFPDGNGAVGAIYMMGWQEYVGSCLLQPFYQDSTYTLQFSVSAAYVRDPVETCPDNINISSFSPVEISIFGNTNCITFPVNTESNNYGCPPGWILLGSVAYSPESEWSEVSITINPTVDINAIMFGPPCNLPPDYSDNGCMPYFFYDNFQLINPSLYNHIQVTSTGGFCSNDLLLTAQSDSANGSWQWYRNGIAITGENDSTFLISNNGEGIYNVVYNLHGQCILSDDFEVANPTPIADFTYNFACAGSPVYFYDESSIETGFIIDWHWDFGDGTNSISEYEPTHIFETPGTFNVTLTVTSNENCSGNFTFPLLVNEIPQITIGGDTTICEGASVQLNATGGTYFFWTPTNDLNDPYINNPIATPYETTTYYLYTYNVNTSCENSATQTVTLANPSTINIKYEFDISLTCDSVEVTFINNSVNEEYFTWNFGDGTTSSEINPIHNYAYGDNYYINLIGKTCHSTLLKSLDAVNFYDTIMTLIPNIITPNNDALNDCFSPALSSEFSECSEITIYNRWGNVVFEKEKGEEKCWDGKNKSDNTYLEAGTYFYVMKVNDVDIKHGTVTLIRD